MSSIRKKQKPRLSLVDIITMSFGFMGIQMGFALQNANGSRILQTFGADVEHLSLFWLVAPFTGMIIQPIIGHYSDKTWTSLGRRRPYFLSGAILAAIGLLLMPNASLFTAFLPALWVGAGMLMIMDASFNVAMEPFRALVADKLPSDQRTLGFSVQTILIGIGAVFGSWLPSLLVYFGVSSVAPEGEVPMNVVWSFVIGAIFLVTTILITVFTTKEYSPEEQASFQEDSDLLGSQSDSVDGILDDVLDRPHTGSAAAAPEHNPSGIMEIFSDFAKMPKTMKQLGLVQFFSWFALFSMWVFTTPSLAQNVWGLSPDDHSSAAFNEAGNYVGNIFGTYNLVATVFAFLLPTIAQQIGRKSTHAVSLIIGGLGLISILFITSPEHKAYLHLSMVGVGIAWASILAMPYAILAGSIPARKMGVYMGIFNFFITFPQIANGFLGGPIVKYFYNDHAVYALVAAGVFMIFGAISVKFVEDKDDVVVKK
jgi:maltose/moltooligosaccharide transporter